MCENILIVFVDVQDVIHKTPKLNVSMSFVCECHTFIFIFNSQVNTLIFVLVYLLDNLIVI